MPRILVILLSLFLAAPALAGTAASEPAAPVSDPLEPFNRAMYGFNRAVLDHVINPTVDTVGPILPGPVKTGLGNAYSNLTEIEFILNNLLTAHPLAAAASAGRFAINSTVGIAGLFDVASAIGLKRRESDFIESLCQTGVPPGPYTVLPLVGSANLYSAATLASAVALEVYGLSFISMALATADFIVIDLGGSAATLRYMNTVPVAKNQDAYEALRTDHLDYVRKGCEGDPAQRLASRP